MMNSGVLKPRVLRLKLPHDSRVVGRFVQKKGLNLLPGTSRIIAYPCLSPYLHSPETRFCNLHQEIHILHSSIRRYAHLTVTQQTQVSACWTESLLRTVFCCFLLFSDAFCNCWTKASFPSNYLSLVPEWQSIESQVSLAVEGNANILYRSQIGIFFGEIYTYVYITIYICTYTGWTSEW